MALKLVVEMTVASTREATPRASATPSTTTAWSRPSGDAPITHAGARAMSVRKLRRVLSRPAHARALLPCLSMATRWMATGSGGVGQESIQSATAARGATMAPATSGEICHPRWSTSTGIHRRSAGQGCPGRPRFRWSRHRPAGDSVAIGSGSLLPSTVTWTSPTKPPSPWYGPRPLTKSWPAWPAFADAL